MLRANLKWNLAARSIGSYLAVLIVMTGIGGCDRAVSAPDKLLEIAANHPALSNTDGPLSEVNIPASISQLAPSLAKFQPQVQILSPKFDEVLADDRVSVKLKVRDLPLSKSELGLGNHLQVILDKQPAQSVYDLSQPLVFKNLTAGTHTLRVLAARPWHESFKNDGAFAIVTFHVLTKTAENNPDLHQPLLTYNQPIGNYGAEPILLDYHLTNLPSQSVPNQSLANVPDWRIRVTVNEQTFILGGVDDAAAPVEPRQPLGTAAMAANYLAPIYLQGFKPGKNWVRLELIDDRGNPIPNVYNDTVEIFTYQPGAADPLARLVRGEIAPELALTLVDPDRIAINPTPTPSASIPPTLVPIPVPSVIAPSPTIPLSPSPIVLKPSPSPVAIVPPIVIPPSPPPIALKPIPSPVAIVPPIVIQPSPPQPSTPPIVVKPIPSPVAIVPPIVIPSSPPQPSTPQIALKPIPSPVAIVPPIVIQPRPIPSVKILPIPEREVVQTPKLAPSIGSPAKTPTSNPAPQPQHPEDLVKLFPIEIVPPQVAKSPVPAPTALTPSTRPIAPLAGKIPVGQVQPGMTVLILPQTVIDELIKPRTPTGTPTATAILLPQSVVDELVKVSARQQSQSSPVIETTPNVPAPQLDTKPTTTWQTQAIELFDLTRAKIRVFTNTIPAKAQRFGDNMRLWWNSTIDKLRQE